MSDIYKPEKLPGDGRISIPDYLLPDELRELHERIRLERAKLRQLERAFQDGVRELLQAGRSLLEPASGVIREID